MRKKISVNDLILGMYIDELCGNWMDHPFWKNAFKLEDANDLLSLKRSNIQQVWIDTIKGLDVPVSVEDVVSENEVEQDAKQVLLAAQTQSKQVVVAKFTDETIFQAFVRTIGIYPVGTLLKLKSGRLGVVVDQSQKSLLEPIVKIFFSTRSNTGIPIELIDMSHTQDSIENIEDVAKWGFDLEKITGIC